MAARCSYSTIQVGVSQNGATPSYHHPFLEFSMKSTNQLFGVHPPLMKTPKSLQHPLPAAGPKPLQHRRASSKRTSRGRPRLDEAGPSSSEKGQETMGVSIFSMVSDTKTWFFHIFAIKNYGKLCVLHQYYGSSEFSPKNP